MQVSQLNSFQFTQSVSSQLFNNVFNSSYAKAFSQVTIREEVSHFFSFVWQNISIKQT